MLFRMLPIAALVLNMLGGATVLAADAEKPNTHDGKIVSITADELVMTGADGEEHSHALASDTRLTLDGQACQASDLKAGLRIRVTVKSADSQEAVHVEALDKNPEFASR